MIIQGRAFKFGDNIDTDIVIPGRYLASSDPKELGEHCMEGADPRFASKVKKGDVLVAGRNFGCGSSREHAPIALKACGIGAVIASSFARIFFRNAVNIGLTVLESPEASAAISEGHEIRIDVEAGIIWDLSSSLEFTTKAYPPLVMGIVQAGGLVTYVQRKLGANKRRVVQ